MVKIRTIGTGICWDTAQVTAHTFKCVSYSCGVSNETLILYALALLLFKESFCVDSRQISETGSDSCLCNELSRTEQGKRPKQDITPDFIRLTFGLKLSVFAEINK